MSEYMFRKKIIYGMLFVIAISLQAMEREPISNSSQKSLSSRMYTGASGMLSKAKETLYATPLVAGWRSTKEEKERAYEKIRNLLFEKDGLEDTLKNISKGSSEWQVAQNRIAEIDADLYTQKIITGDKWTSTRKLVMGAVGVGTIAGGLYLVATSVQSGSATPGQNIGRQNDVKVEIPNEFNFIPDKKEPYVWIYFYKDRNGAYVWRVVKEFSVNRDANWKKLYIPNNMVNGGVGLFYGTYLTA